MSSAITKASTTTAKHKTAASKESSSINASLTSIRSLTSWNPVIGVFLALLIFIGAQVISGIILSYYRYPKHWSNQQLLNWLNNSISAQFLFILIAEGLVVFGVYIFVRRYKTGFKAIGFRRPRWSDPLFGLLALPVYLLIYLIAVVIITYLIPGLNVNEKQQLGFNNISGVGQIMLTFLSLVILPPIAEEMLFRGFLYSSLKKNLPTIVAVVVTSALFAIGHLPEGGSAGPLYIAAIDTFILSLVLIYLREKTGGLWASMTLHALKNSIAFVLLYVAYIH